MGGHRAPLARDVTQDDFATLFAPGGKMDQFFQTHLAALVDTSTAPWSFRRISDVPVGGPDSLVQFQRAQKIREGLSAFAERRIWVMNVDGSGLRPLTRTPGYDAEATIAPDGRIADNISQKPQQLAASNEHGDARFDVQVETS